MPTQTERSATAPRPPRAWTRRTFALSAAICFVACVWVLCGWYRSTIRPGPFGRVQAASFATYFARGYVIVQHGAGRGRGPGPSPQANGKPAARFTGPWRVRAPCLPAVVVLATVPAAWLLRRGAGGPRGPNDVCPWCGYDVRATPYRCPDCGTELPALKQAVS